MSRAYKFHKPEAGYFVSFAVVEWLHVFTKEKYTKIALDCLTFCQKEKGLEIYSWVIMTNHLHLVFRSVGDQKPGHLLGDFKRFTSNAIVKAIKEDAEESNREHWLKEFKKAANKSHNVNHHQFWQHDNHPIEIYSYKFVSQKINYVHNNPVKAGYVSRPEDYKYSSAKDYAGEKGLLDDIVIAL
jgi:REP element-mobilizing transposase RayT